MNKKNAIFIAMAVSICLVSLLAVLPSQQAGQDRTDWMADLDDDRTINTLSIPGTHDSGATHSIADLSGKCQSLTIAEQLKLGVRFFDVRLQLKNNELVVVHSFVDQGTAFSDILRQMTDFLRENPTEFLIVSFKEDNDPVGSDVSFSEKLEKMLTSYDNVSRDGYLPETVGEARGRLHVISRYNSTIGVPAYDGWRDSTSFELGELYVQDHYQVDSAETKIEDIKSALAIGETGEYALVLNFTSCYYPDGFPPTYAGTPALTINPWLIDALSERDNANCVFLCDFITSELCDAIIEVNFR